MKRRLRPRRRTAAILAAAALTAGCSGLPPDGASPTAELMVFAAGSLRSVFTDLGAQLEDVEPGTSVRFNFAGSSDLVAQLTQGAPADLFASADPQNMTRAVDAGLVDGEPVTFAANTLTIVTPPGNPKGVASFADLAEPGTSVVVCAPQVPCGAAAEKLEQDTGVTLTPVSEESSVTDVLGKITSGQADAGLVYVTDARLAGDQVTEVSFPESAGARNSYPIAVLEASDQPELARQFVDLVTGPTGRRLLAEAGFAVP